MTARRRPAPRRERAASMAAGTLGLRLVAAERPRPTLGRLAGQLLGGLVRPGDTAPFRIEVVELRTDRILAVEPVNGTESQAQERLALMRIDLDRLDDRAFLRRWRRRP